MQIAPIYPEQGDAIRFTRAYNEISICSSDALSARYDTIQRSSNSLICLCRRVEREEKVKGGKSNDDRLSELAMLLHCIASRLRKRESKEEGNQSGRQRGRHCALPRGISPFMIPHSSSRGVNTQLRDREIIRAMTMRERKFLRVRGDIRRGQQDRGHSEKITERGGQKKKPSPGLRLRATRGEEVKSPKEDQPP